MQAENITDLSNKTAVVAGGTGLPKNADAVRRIRNHPSVLIWTIGSEMLLRDNENVEKWKQLPAVVKFPILG